MRPLITLFGLIVVLISFSAPPCAFMSDVLDGQKPCDCIRINNEENKLLITYERVGSHASENDTVWLRFHNETSCPIFVPTDHEYSFKRDDGQMTFDIKDGSVVFVKYEVEKPQMEKSKNELTRERWISYLDGATYATRLVSGNSLLFYIPTTNLKQARYLAVRYTCQKDSNFTATAPRVLFNLKNLPKDIFDLINK